MIEYQFAQALEQLHRFHSLKSHLEETEKALEFINRCNYVQLTKDEQKAKELILEILEYYKSEDNWVKSFEEPYLKNRRLSPVPSVWGILDFIKRMTPFYFFLRIGKNELFSNLVRRSIE